MIEQERTSTSMAGSSGASFPWTAPSMEAALHTIFRLTQKGPKDPFNENILLQATSKLRATPWDRETTAPLLNVTTDDLRALLNERRQTYQRICELADSPSTLGFSSVSNRIMMFPDQYERHIQVCYI